MLIKWELITWLKAGAKSLIANNTIHLHFYTFYRLCLYFCFTLSHAHCQISMMISESGVDLFHSLPKIVPDIKPTYKMLWRQPTSKGRLKYLGWYCIELTVFCTQIFKLHILRPFIWFLWLPFHSFLLPSKNSRTPQKNPT